METPELVTKYYHKPFKNYDSVYIFDSNMNMCLDTPIENINFIFLQHVCHILNDELTMFNKTKELIFNKETNEISIGGKIMLRIRGWGRLQQIKEDSPELIQDTFAQWVFDKLVERNTTPYGTETNNV